MVEMPPGLQLPVPKSWDATRHTQTSEWSSVRLPEAADETGRVEEYDQDCNETNPKSKPQQQDGKDESEDDKSDGRSNPSTGQWSSQSSEGASKNGIMCKSGIVKFQVSCKNVIGKFPRPR